jgi:DNA-3-methyladenine glycosylase II
MNYMAHLQKDKKLGAIIQQPLDALQLHKNIPLRLIASIMSQQLNTKVAAIIYGRFLEIYNGKEPSPQQVLDTPFDVLRSIGLSNAKVNYVHHVARFCIENKITDKKLMVMDDAEIIKLLTQIKGVGQWTVEMLLMSTLGREDIFAIDDWGIQSGMMKLYKLENLEKKPLREKLLSISKKWSPYRTYACMHIWRWKDGG